MQEGCDGTDVESRLIEYMRTRLIRLSVLIPSLWLVPALCAQATVELIVERTGFQGETLSAVISVGGFQECGTPVLPEIVDCAVCR